jgi:hypothetical protein
VDPPTQYDEPEGIPPHLNPFVVRANQNKNMVLSYTQVANMTESQKDNIPVGGESRLEFNARV